MDIGQIDAVIAEDEELAVIPIYKKNGDPYTSASGEPSTISVYGPESKAAKKGKRTEWRKLVKRTGTPELDEVEDGRIEKAIAHVGDWFGWESAGQPAPCTPENIRALFKAEHILAQVEAGVAKHAGFLGR